MERPFTEALTAAPVGHHGPLGGAQLADRAARPRGADFDPAAEREKRVTEENSRGLGAQRESDSEDSEFEREEIRADLTYLKEEEEREKLVRIERELADARAIDEFRDRLLRSAQPYDAVGDEEGRDSEAGSVDAAANARGSTRGTSNPVLPSSITRRTQARGRGSAGTTHGGPTLARVAVPVVVRKKVNATGERQQTVAVNGDPLHRRAAQPLMRASAAPSDATAAGEQPASRNKRPAPVPVAPKLPSTTTTTPGSQPAKRRKSEKAVVSLVDY